MITKPIFKILLAIEVLICFGPLSLVLLVGLAMAPMQLHFLLTLDSEARPGALFVLTAVGAGLAGIAALANVLLWLFSPPSSLFGPRWTLASMALGMLPLAFYAFGPIDTLNWRLAGLLPLASTVHIAWLAREFLFPGFTARRLP